MSNDDGDTQGSAALERKGGLLNILQQQNMLLSQSRASTPQLQQQTGFVTNDEPEQSTVLNEPSRATSPGLRSSQRPRHDSFLPPGPHQEHPPVQLQDGSVEPALQFNSVYNLMSHASAVPDLPVVQTPAPAPSIPAESSISGVSNLLSGSGDDPLLASSPCKADTVEQSEGNDVEAEGDSDLQSRRAGLSAGITINGGAQPDGNSAATLIQLDPGISPSVREHPNYPEEENTAPYRHQFVNSRNDVTLSAHMSAIPEYLRRFFSDALAVVIPVSSNQVTPAPPMEDVDKGQPSAHKKEDTEQSRDGGLSKPSSIRFATLKDDDSALSDQDISPNPDIGAHSTRFQTTAEDIAKVDVQASGNGSVSGKQPTAQERFGVMTSALAFASMIQGSMRIPKAKTDMPGIKSYAPRQVKSAMKAPDAAKRRRGKRTVRFKGMVAPTLANVVSLCVQYARVGSSGAAWWEAFMALVITLDFFCVPSAIVSAAYAHAIHKAHVGEGELLDFTFFLLAIDVVFFCNIAFSICQAFVWDLGFKDMPVDKIVEASISETRGKDRVGKAHADIMLAAMEALSNAPPGSMPGARMRGILTRFIPVELLCSIPQLLGWALKMEVHVKAAFKLLRVIRVTRLLAYFSKRQEDLSADVRWIAACKFIFFLFATAHWIGCVMFYYAAETGFSERQYAVNWITGWVEQESLQYNWRTATAMQTYVIILYKGFSMITNLAYEEEVPELLNEIYIGLISQNLKVIIDAYILGTLFHYLVKKDPAEEASQELMRALKVYCDERDLPSSLYEKMQDYLRFQQQHSTSVTDHVIRLLPASLQTRLAEEHCSEAVRRNMHLFAGCDVQFRLRFMMQMQEVYLMPSESVVKKSEISRELNFVTKGTLVVTDSNNVLIQLVTGEGTAPSVVGEVSFLMGVPEPYYIRARENEDTAVLSISKSDFNGVIAAYPEQNDIIMTNMLSQYGLTRDGEDTGTGAAAQGDDEASAQMREDIIHALKRTQDAAVDRLTVAATEGDLESVKNLLARGLPINKADYNGRSTLHLAVGENRTDIVSVLLDKGAKTDLADIWGSSPLSDALQNRRVDIAAALITKGARMADPAQFALVMDAAEKEWTLLNLMCIKGGVDSNSADYDSRSVMHVAASTGNLRVVQGLLQVGANVNIRDRWGFQPLDDAIKSHDPILFHLLTGSGAKLSEDFQRNAILDASREGSIHMINLLGESGADLNGCNYDQMTGLHMAARGGHLLVLARLAALQFLDINKVDTWGYTPLDHSVDAEHWPCAVLLLSMGGEMRQPKSQKSLADAVAAQLLPKLAVLRATIRTAFMSSCPELHELTSPMGSKCDDVLQTSRQEASNMLVATMKDVTSIRQTTEELMATLDEINTISFVLLKVLSVTAPRKKQGLNPKKVNSSSNNSGSKGPTESTSGLDAQVSKGLMAVFMKATLVEQAMMDFIVCANESCDSRDSEENQLQDIFSALGLQYDQEKASDIGGASCFSGPEGHKKLSALALMATPIFRVTVQPGGIALPAPGQQRRSVAAGRVSTSPTSALADAQAAANESDSDDDEGEGKSGKQDGPSICKSLAKCHGCIDACFKMLDLGNQGAIDVGEFGPVIYKNMQKLGLARLWEALSSASEATSQVTRDEFTKVFLAWLGIGEQFELSAMNQGSEHGDDVDSDLLDLDEAANVGADSGVADDEALSDGEVEEFGKNLNLGSRPFAALIRLTLLERLQWMAGFPLKNTEIAHRIMMKLDKERTGNLPLVALDFILKQIQGELPISKETFDLAEKMKVERTSEGLELKEADLITLMLSIRITTIDTTMPEDCSPYVVHPDAYFLRNFFDPAVRLVAAVYFLEVPFAIAFHPEHSIGEQYVRSMELIGIVPVLDIFLTFFRAYYLPNGTLIYDLPSIRLHYTATRLLLDLLAFFPFDVMMTLYSAHHHPYVGFVRLPRMLGVYTTWYMRGYTLAVKADTPMSVAIIRLLFITAVITHMFACVWWYIGSHHMLDVSNHYVTGFAPHDDPHEREVHWIYYYHGLGREEIADYHTIYVGLQYVFTYYWCASTLTTAGRIGQVTPKNFAELLFTIVSMIFTSVFYGYVMGEITNLVMSNDDALVQKRQKFGLVQTFLSKRRLKPDLAKDIVEVFYEKVNSQQNTERVFDSLSSSLKVEVAMHISLPLVKSNNVFGGCSSGFTASLSVLMREMAFTGDETIFHTNDVCSELFLIAKNTVKIMVVKDGQQTVQETRGKGQLLGEASFFFRLRHINTAVVAEGSTMLFVLSYDDYQQLSSAYVSDAAAVMDIIIDLVNDSGKAGKSQGSASSGGPENQEVSEAHKVRAKIMDAVKRQSEQLVVAFLKAAAGNERGAVDDILDEGSIEVDDSDGASRTALHLAAANGHLSMVTRLVTKYAASPTIKDRYGSTPIDDAIRHKHMAVVEFLATQAVATDINSDAYVEQFIQAAADNEVEVLQILAVAGIDCNCADYDSRTALHLSVSNGCMDATKFLLAQKGIDVNCQDRFTHTPLWDAIARMDIEAARLLRGAGGNVQDGVAQKLCEEARRNNVSLFELLHAVGVDIYSRNPYGRTPLHIAASVGAVRTCDGIVAATTAGVNRTDMFGTTALDNARSKGQAAVEAIIIARGGLSGDDPRVQKEHEDVREFIETNNKHEMVRRKTRILDGLPEAKLRHTLLCVVSALQNFMECSFINMQIFLSALRKCINTEGEVAGGNDEDGMRNAIDALVATFSELQEVLDRPMMQYAVMKSFLVNALGRSTLTSRMDQSKKVLVESMREMKEVQKRLKKGPLEVQEYGRQQLQGMLSVGPYVYLQVPTPTCASSISDDKSSQAVVWKRTAVADCEGTISKEVSEAKVQELNALMGL